MEGLGLGLGNETDAAKATLTPMGRPMGEREGEKESSRMGKGDLSSLCLILN